MLIKVICLRMSDRQRSTVHKYMDEDLNLEVVTIVIEEIEETTTIKEEDIKITKNTKIPLT